MTPRFLRAMVAVLSHEGGPSDNPHDPGGQTRWGISSRQYPSEDIAHLTLARALELYWRDYWQPLKLDEFLSSPIACKVFDISVNAGAKAAVELLQQAINQIREDGGQVAVDGQLGRQTLQAVNQIRNAELVIATLCGLQWQYYQRLVGSRPALQVFLAGWTVRSMYRGGM